MHARSDSLFKKLSDAQRDQLMLFIHTKVGGDVYRQGAGLCAEWGIKCSRSAVHDFYSRHGFSWRLDRAQAAAMATSNSSSFEEEAKLMLQQKIFEAISNPEVDPNVLIACRSLELQAKDLGLKERRVTMLEKRLARAQEIVKKAADPKSGGLTPETLEKIKGALGL